MYKIKTRYGILFFDPDEKDLFKAITIKSKSPRNSYVLAQKLRQRYFVDNKGKKCKLPEDRLKFFTDFLPRTMGEHNPEIEKVE